MTKAHPHRQVNVHLDTIDDADVIERIEAQPSMVGYVRELVRRDIHGEQLDCMMLKTSELQSENAKLRTQLADVTASMGRVEERCAELRELAVLQSVIFKHMSTCPTTDCQVCPVNDECAESVYLEGVLGIDDKETSWLVQWRSEDAADVRAENAKLRELVRVMHDELVSCEDNGYVCGGHKFDERVRELGIEVDG